MSPVARLRAVLDDVERAAWAEKCLGVEVFEFASDRETVQRERRRRLEARGRFARAVDAHPGLGVDRDLGPESIADLEAADPEAAEAWHGRFRDWNQVVFVCGEKTVRLYVNGSYAYTFKQGSSLLVNAGGRGRRWEPRDWYLWPLEDVVDIAPRVLEEHSGLAEAWRGIAARDTEEEEES